MSERINELCIVHLVHAHNGIEPFRCFLDSYRANPGGIEHDLLIVFKGFGQPQDTAEYREALIPFQHSTFIVPDEGFDIGAYLAVVNHYSEQYRYFCFLNSFSVIQDRKWLIKLYKNLSKPGVGLVGATGSCMSHNTSARSWFRVVATTIFSQGYTRHSKKGKKQLDRDGWQHKEIDCWKSTISKIRRILYHSMLMMNFDPFPNYHIRTNVFMISSAMMMSLKFHNINYKMDAYKFESGKRGITKQILNKGKKVIVVGKDGIGYDKEIWHQSKTFWSFEQENLLVADNQTLKYQKETVEGRRYLNLIAWGIGHSGKQ